LEGGGRKRKKFAQAWDYLAIKVANTTHTAQANVIKMPCAGI